MQSLFTSLSFWGLRTFFLISSYPYISYTHISPYILTDHFRKHFREHFEGGFLKSFSNSFLRIALGKILNGICVEKSDSLNKIGWFSAQLSLTYPSLFSLSQKHRNPPLLVNLSWTPTKLSESSSWETTRCRSTLPEVLC